MATGTANAAAKSPTSAASQNEQYIEQQLDRTRANVKLVDLFGGLMIMTAGILAFLLAAAVVDAWVFELGLASRLLALLILVGGSGVYFVRLVLPLLIRRINPAYAARAIEQSQPSLKNSLINFLMMRAHREQENAVVYQAVEQQAAANLSHVAIESAVDRTKLIRIGYVLAGIVLVCGVYKVISPKDPFQTIKRIALPLADMQAPSRVQISDVAPTDTDVFFGDTLNISATIHGTDDDEPVTLIYSSADGQIVGRHIAMTSNAGGSSYKGVLSPGPSGIQQDLIYRLVAGDAETRNYRVTVKTSPSIVVRELKYEFQRYTRRPERIVEGQPDIRELEGTRVAITATANLPIKSAYLELNVEGDQEDTSLASTTRSARVPMSVNGREAVGQITLELKADGKTPVHGNYRVRFRTEDGSLNDNASIHTIEVSPDLAPEVHILSPTSERIELDRFETQAIEVRALDPDFALSQVKLRAVSGGTDLINRVLFKQVATAGKPVSLAETIDVPLLPLAPLFQAIDDQLAEFQNSAEPRQQLIANFDFTPSDYGLRAGDEVVFWATAEDNRTSALHQLPEPNSARTVNHLIVVTERSIAPKDDASDEEKDPDKSDDPESGDDEMSDEGGRDGDGGSSAADGAGSADDAGGSESSDGGASGSEEGSESTEPQDTMGDDSGGSSSQSDSSDGSSSDSTDSTSEGGEPSDGESGDPQATGAEGGDSGDQTGAPSDAEQPPRDSEGGGATGRQSDEPAHDGEAFERLLEKLEEYKRQQEKENNKGSSNDPSSGNPDGEADDKSSDKSDTADRKPTQDPQNTGTGGDKEERKGSPMNDSGSIEDGEELGKTDADPKSDETGGEGGVPQGSQETRKDDAEDSKKSDKEKGPGEGDGGQSGAGTDTGSETGSPPGQTRNEDKEKKMDPRDSGTDMGDQPKSPTNSDRQSDSDSDTSGDRSGGGGEGGGQGANRDGNDSSGSNSAGDFGGGAANEKGGGETAAGGDKTAEDETGVEGSDPGDGSDTRGNPEGDETVDQAGNATGNGSKGSPFGGAGGTADGTPSGAFDTDEVPPGEKANLEYTKKATDLALEYLKDQEDKQAELADELGWTDEELREFVKRWETMKRNAREGDLGARRELDRSLRSLGLRPGDDTNREAVTQDDALRGLRDSGLRSNPPAKYLEQFNAFIKGTAAAETDE